MVWRYRRPLNDCTARGVEPPQAVLGTAVTPPLLLGVARARTLPCGAAARGGYRRPPPALALVSCPKQRHLWAAVAHRGARSTLDEFKAAWEGRLTHHGDTPKILPSNLPPAAIADRRIGLGPYSPRRRSWLVSNLAHRTYRHRILQQVHVGPARGPRTAAMDCRSRPGVLCIRSAYQAWARRP